MLCCHMMVDINQSVHANKDKSTGSGVARFTNKERTVILDKEVKHIIQAKINTVAAAEYRNNSW